MKRAYQNTVSFISIALLIFTFSCKKEDDDGDNDETIYKEELFANVNWKITSSNIVNEISYYYSSGNVLYITKDFSEVTTVVQASCDNDYSINFSTDTSYVKMITGSTYCDNNVPANSVERYAQWYIVNGKIVVNSDEEYYQNTFGTSEDEIRNRYYELISLNDTSMTLQRTISGNYLKEFLNYSNDVGGSIVITTNYVNENANSFSNLRTSSNILPSSDQEAKEADTLSKYNNIFYPF